MADSETETENSFDIFAPEEAREGGSGPQVIAGYVKHLGTGPGVYRMLDASRDVIYVGKARNLKARVQNYARLGGHSNRIARMIASTVAMEFVNTATEAEALLLEANLIKRFKPRYNVLFRDDKSFPHILIARDHEAPQILKHRGARARKGDYFGPFASAGAVNRTINTLQRAFLLRSCSDSVYESRTRPCLLYQIKRCAAPCTGEIAIDEYNKLVNEAVAFLSGKSDTVQKKLNALMEDASEKLEFERAAKYRNRLWALAHIQAHQGINPQSVEEADVFAVTQKGGQTCIQVFFFRNNQNWGNRAYFPRADRSLTSEDVLSAFIAQFYDDKIVPRCVLLSHEVPEQGLIAEALSTKLERKVEVVTPKRGEKRELVEYALQNAREALGRKLAEASSQGRLLEGVGKTFGLEHTPRRIEVFDNSHIMGANAVGAMIVAGPEGFVKSHYRKFNIKSDSLVPGDDFGMMREMLNRRFKRLVKEHGLPAAETSETVGYPVGNGAIEESETNGDQGGDVAAWPDLVFIDGGAGQLSAAHEILAQLGLHGLPLVGIAKGPDRNAGRERFFLPGKPPFSLEPRDPVLYFVQRLRDEAHRFAIGSHRQKRKKAMGENALDGIPGVGPSRKRALLKHFGSAKSVSRAGVEDLQAVEGISAAMAEAIYNHFHER
jgi:excinuclease ABC subunit C